MTRTGQPTEDLRSLGSVVVLPSIVERGQDEGMVTIVLTVTEDGSTGSVFGS